MHLNAGAGTFSESRSSTCAAQVPESNAGVLGGFGRLAGPTVFGRRKPCPRKTRRGKKTEKRDFFRFDPRRRSVASGPDTGILRIANGNYRDTRARVGRLSCGGAAYGKLAAYTEVINRRHPSSSFRRPRPGLLRPHATVITRTATIVCVCTRTYVGNSAYSAMG